MRHAFHGRSLVTLFGLLSVGIAIPSSANPEKDWPPHTDKGLQVTFPCPKEWKPDRQAYQDRTYFYGLDEQRQKYLGFVQLQGSGGGTPQQECRGSASHHLQPYGAHPQIRSMKIQGQKACLVWPSAEQGKDADALLVVEYPRHMKIDGQYGQLMLIADKNHILQISETIRFSSLTSKNPAIPQAGSSPPMRLQRRP